MRLRSNSRWIVALAAACAMMLSSCGSDDADSSSGSDDVSGDITVFAAASLTEAFTEIADDFKAANPDATVKFNFGGSSTLAQQINQGAPADVFASANEDQMKVVDDDGNAAGDPEIFVQNKLQIVVPQGNPGNVTGIEAFGEKDLDIAICADEVPCGEASKEVFDIAGVDAKPDTLEKDVKAVLTKVSAGEVDAGLVYVTDATAAGGDLTTIDFPEADEAINDYPIAALKSAPNSAGAKAFVDYVLSEKGMAVLKKYGFKTGVS